MRKRIKHLLFHQDNPGLQYAVPIVFIGVLMLGVLTALLMNTVGLHRRLQENTEKYADDISAQLASNISARMELRKTCMHNLADTLSEMPEILLTEELLDRKAQYLEMKEIFVLKADGTTIPADTGHMELEGYLAEHPEMYEAPYIFFTEHDEVFFFAPIFWDNGGEASLLIGVRTNTVLQQMLQEVDFKDQGLCCIVDRDGTMVVSATDEAPFQELSAVFNKSLDSGDAAEARRVLEDINEHRSGVAQFKDIGGEPLMLGYDFLGINDWMLLTLLPSNLFSEGTGAYLIQNVVIIGIMALTMALIFAYIVWSYRQSLKKIQAVALTDSLTGGKNNLAFQMAGTSLLREHPQKRYAIVCLNIRNFKRLNERFGVKTGDALLRQMYGVLQDCLHKGELMSRAAGDHFYLLLECGGEEDVRSRLQTVLGRLEEQLPEQFSIDRTRVSQGAYLIPNWETDFLILQDRAKMASTYQLENEPCRFYDDSLGKQVDREQSLDDSFKSAIRNREFKLYIQPKVCPNQNRTQGGEVLVRWQHPEYGLLFPGEFIPLFEQNGKIQELDFYMFEETCKLLKAWLAEGRAMPLSVNLFRAHLISGDMSCLDRFKSIKEAYQIPDGLIELELTESLMLERREVGVVAGMIDCIRSMGFLCSMDDFGFGYSSLALLKDLNVDTVKLDRQFFVGESEKSWIVVGQLIRLAHELGITVVAEGIEDKSQVEKLRQYDCDLIQGYVYAKPMSVPDFQNWVATQ